MRFNRLKRRQFITLLGGAAAAWPLAAGAQQAAIPVIGFPNPTLPEAITEPIRGFRQGLKDAGYVEGESIAIEFRFANNHPERLPEIAAAGPASRVILVHRRDQDLPPSTQLRTAGCHHALIRRVAELRPDVHLIAFHRGCYRRWLDPAQTLKEMQAGGGFTGWVFAIHLLSLHAQQQSPSSVGCDRGSRAGMTGCKSRFSDPWRYGKLCFGK